MFRNRAALLGGSTLAGVLLAGGDLTAALAAIALLVLGSALVGLWLPALGRGPTGEAEPLAASS